MSACPVCQNDFPALQPGQLCPKCSAQVLAHDMYSASDLRFVGVLAGVLTAAVASLPGALAGHLIGRGLGQAVRGCTIGVIVFSLVGLAIGFVIGPKIVLKMEAAKRGA